MSVTLFMPVLNEIDGLRALLPRIDRGWFDQILMVDGGSRDGSGACSVRSVFPPQTPRSRPST